jgi:integrase
MKGQRLGLGEHGEIDAVPQRRDESGKWKTVQYARKTDRWRARCRFRGFDGQLGEVSRIGKTRREAIAAVEAALDHERKSLGDVEWTPTTKLIRAGELWLTEIGRSDSGLSERTVTDYGRTFHRYIDAQGSTLRGLTLTQANDPQRLRRFLQAVADRHGTGAAKITRSVLSGILSMAVDNGTLSTNAMRQVRAVKAQNVKETERDTDRAFTREERDGVIAHADALAETPAGRPQTARKWQTTADLIAFMAGTGVRIAEARALRWEDVDLGARTVEVQGTKSKSAHRRLSMPVWLVQRMEARAERVGSTGYVFASPHLADSERQWDQSNCSKSLAAVLDGAGFPWATPHTFRRTVASLLHEAGWPLVRIADQLGHSDPAMTAREYLGRDFGGDKSDLAAAL